MTKGTSEGKVRLALNLIGGLVVYKPPDDARNWKPCDFMVWWSRQGSSVPDAARIIETARAFMDADTDLGRAIAAANLNAAIVAAQPAEEGFRDPTAAPATLLRSAWIEVKECALVGSFPLADLRKNQRAGIRDAAAIGLPYLLVIWWPKRRIWTISDAIALSQAPLRGSVAYSILAGKIGIDAQQSHLAETLRAVLQEGLLDGTTEA